MYVIIGALYFFTPIWVSSEMKGFWTQKCQEEVNCNVKLLYFIAINICSFIIRYLLKMIKKINWLVLSLNVLVFC